MLWSQRTGSQLQMNRLSLRNNRSKFETAGKLPFGLEESIEYTQFNRGNRRMPTCNRLDLHTLGSQPVMPKKFPKHCNWCSPHVVASIEAHPHTDLLANLTHTLIPCDGMENYKMHGSLMSQCRCVWIKSMPKIKCFFGRTFFRVLGLIWFP